MKKIFSIAVGSLYLLILSCGNPSQNQEPQQTASQASAEAPAQQQQQQQQPAVANVAQNPASHIPEFKFYILKNGIKFDNKDMVANKTHVFVLFDPSCSHCQDEAGDIGKNLATFKNTEFYFISMNDPGLMSTFFASYAPQLKDKENIHLLYDKDMQFIYKFHVPSQYPATYVYRADASLKTFWNGSKSPEDLIKAITN